MESDYPNSEEPKTKPSNRAKAMIFLVGYSVLCWGSKRNEVPGYELFALSFGLGLGSTGLILFFFSLVGIIPSRPVIAIITAAAGSATLMANRRKRLVRIARPAPSTNAEKVIFGILLVPLLMAAIIAFSPHNM